MSKRSRENDRRLKEMSAEDRKRCAMHAAENGRRLQEEGYKVRYPKVRTGTYKGSPHYWVEYFKNGKWLVFDTAVEIIDFPIKRCKPLCGKPWYTVEKYYYPQS